MFQQGESWRPWPDESNPSLALVWGSGKSLESRHCLQCCRFWLLPLWLVDRILKIWRVLVCIPEWSVTLFNQGNHIRIMLWMMYPTWLGLQYVEHSVSQPCNFWWSRSIPVCGCSQNNYVSVRVTRNFWHFWQLNWVLFSQKYTNCCSLALNTHHCLNWIWEAFF